MQFVLCSHCGKEGHLEWQCLDKTSDEEMTLARNNEQDKDDGDKKAGEEHVDGHKQFMSADEDEDEPEDDDEAQDYDMEMI